MPKVRALKETRYASTLRHPGDTFDVASDRDARLLVAIGKVELVPAGPAGKVAKAATTDEPAIEADASAPDAGGKRRYTRRDMAAED